MEQEPHYEAGLPADEAAERERLSNDALEHGISGERDERFNHDLAAAAMQQVVKISETGSGSEQQSQAGAEQAAATSPGDTDQALDGEAVPTRSSQRPESDRRLLANVYADLKRHTVALLLDDVTANMVIYAVRVLAADSEAHAREIRLVAATMPPDSYGAANRHAIASRHERIALRLRALENSYRDEITTARESLERVPR